MNGKTQIPLSLPNNNCWTKIKKVQKIWLLCQIACKIIAKPVRNQQQSSVWWQWQKTANDISQLGLSLCTSWWDGLIWRRHWEKRRIWASGSSISNHRVSVGIWPFHSCVTLNTGCRWSGFVTVWPQFGMDLELTMSQVYFQPVGRNGEPMAWH